MTPPETLVTQRIRTIFETEFEAEGWTLADDVLPRAAGKDGATVAAVAPVQAAEKPGAVQQLVIPCTLQLYLAYTAEPDEFIVVDPNVIVGYADRLRRAFQTQSSGNSDDLWYLRLLNIRYPLDPTANKSRLEADIEGAATNTASFPS